MGGDCSGDEDTAAAAVKVFCSHRRVDKAVVAEFARRLREDGIDAWLDTWEIAPGDDFVAAIERGLDECQVGLVFLSSTTDPGGLWMGNEVSTMTHDRLERSGRVIPVLLDPGAPVPALLRPLDRRTVGEYEAIRDAILGVGVKPPLGPLPGAMRPRELVLRVAGEDHGGLRVELREGGDVLASESGLRFDPGVARTLARFVGARDTAPSPSLSDADWRLLEHDLVELGRLLGAVLFAGSVGEMLAARVAGLAQGDVLELVYEAEGWLLSLPLEAARLARRGDAVLALEARVRVRRRPIGVVREPQPALAHPLKILVAVAAPTAAPGRRGGGPLDFELEQHTILEAVEDQALLGRAEVRMLEVASLNQLRRALERDAYHVLHLSGHGGPGIVMLEDDDFGEAPTTAAELADVLAATGRPVPLVVLSACNSATGGDTDPAGIAGQLVALGVDRVLAMQARVTDRYANDLARGVYERLAQDEGGAVGVALAQARQELETRRRGATGAAGAAGQLIAPEYATATLVAAGADRPIVDHRADAQPLHDPPVHEVHPLLPQLAIEEFIGRRAERQEALHALRDEQRFVAAHGRCAGVVITGMGGTGKSALAGRVAARMIEETWALVVCRGPLRLGEIAQAIASGLTEWAERHRQRATSERTSAALAHAEGLRAAADDQQQLDRVLGALREFQLLVVLDDFEQNLTLGGEQFTDEGAAAQTTALLAAAGRSRFLLTSRYPLPALDVALHEVALSALTDAETRRLVLRLPGLHALPSEDRRTITRAVGGHPRMLELVDALLRAGRGRGTILGKLRILAEQEQVRVRETRDVDTAIADAIRLEARDIVLDELLALLTPAERAAVYQAAPSNLPITPADIAATTEHLGDQDAVNACERLADLSLLSRTGPDTYQTHRWTAQALRQIDQETYTKGCVALAHRRMELAQTDPTYDNEIEALRNLLAGAAWDDASTLTLALGMGPLARFQLAISGFTTEVLLELPPEHPNYAAVTDQAAQADIACGFSARALARYRQLTDLLRVRAEAEPDRADYQRDLTISYNKLGDLMRTVGRGEDATRLYQDALDIARRLAEAEPDRADYQRDLSISYNKLGDLMRDVGRGEDATRLHQDALDIARTLAEAEPDRADYQRDLSISYTTLGILAQSAGRAEDATGYFELDLAIARRLAEREPERVGYQRDLAISCENLGGVIAGAGREDEAASLLREAQEIRQGLDPGATAELERAAGTDAGTGADDVPPPPAATLSPPATALPPEPTKPQPGDRSRPPRRERSARPSATPDPATREPAEVVAATAASGDREDRVDCTVFAPAVCGPGVWLLVQAYLHTPVQAADAASLAQEFDPGTSRRGFRGIELDMPGLRVQEPAQRLVWRGRAEAVTFDVEVPADHPDRSVRGSLVLRRSGIPVGRVGFRLAIAAGATTSPSTPQVDHGLPFKSVFISYASADRGDVLRGVQVLQAAGIGFFQDVLDLEPGQRWERELYRHIDECDLFLLFWSKAAKTSGWVRREVARALERQGGDPAHLPEISPVILPPPPVELPWPELADRHFEDRIVHIIGASR